VDSPRDVTFSDRKPYLSTVGLTQLAGLFHGSTAIRQFSSTAIGQYGIRGFYYPLLVTRYSYLRLRMAWLRFRFNCVTPPRIPGPNGIPSGDV